jgi:hypothetical protein
MTPEQIKRLAEVSERLAEAVISDADPDNWTAPGVRLREMTKEERGDAAWCRKTAVQSVALLVRVQQLLAPDASATPEPPEDTEADIRRAEKAAAEMLERVRSRAAKH